MATHRDMENDEDNDIEGRWHWYSDDVLKDGLTDSVYMQLGNFHQIGWTFENNRNIEIAREYRINPDNTLYNIKWLENNTKIKIEKMIFEYISYKITIAKGHIVKKQ